MAQRYWIDGGSHASLLSARSPSKGTRPLLPGSQFVVAFCRVTVAVRVAPEVSVHVTFMESPG